MAQQEQQQRRNSKSSSSSISGQQHQQRQLQLQHSSRTALAEGEPFCIRGLSVEQAAAVAAAAPAAPVRDFFDAILCHFRSEIR